MGTQITDKLPIRLVVEAAHMPAFYYKQQGNKFSSNKKFMAVYPDTALDDLISAIDIDALHKPSIFQLKSSEKVFDLVAIPLNYGKRRNEVLFLCLDERLSHKNYHLELSDEAWHELNNPIAIISMTLSRARKLKVLDQKSVDSLIDKIRRNFLRIEEYITGQISELS